jgi:hypothetical protein
MDPFQIEAILYLVLFVLFVIGVVGRTLLRVTVYLKSGDRLTLWTKKITTQRSDSNELTTFTWEAHPLARRQLHTITLSDVSAVTYRKGF